MPSDELRKVTSNRWLRPVGGGALVAVGVIVGVRVRVGVSVIVGVALGGNVKVGVAVSLRARVSSALTRVGDAVAAEVCVGAYVTVTVAVWVGASVGVGVATKTAQLAVSAEIETRNNKPKNRYTSIIQVVSHFMIMQKFKCRVTCVSGQFVIGVGKHRNVRFDTHRAQRVV